MNKLYPLLLVFALSLSKANAQSAPAPLTIPTDSTSHRFAYQGVVEVPGLSKDQLYSRALEWVAKTYKSAQAVIQMQDKESGKLVMKGTARVRVRSYPGGIVNHTLSIYIKDGRYKYILTDFTHQAAGAANIFSGGPLESEDGKIYSMGGSKKAWLDIRDQAGRDALALIVALKTAMDAKPGKDPSDF